MLTKLKNIRLKMYLNNRKIFTIQRNCQLQLLFVISTYKMLSLSCMFTTVTHNKQ